LRSELREYAQNVAEQEAVSRAAMIRRLFVEAARREDDRPGRT